MTWELSSRIVACVLYLSAAAAATWAFTVSESWARKASAVWIAAIATGWAGFYLWIIGTDTHAVSNAGTVSRIIHYVTAAGLIAMSGSIIVAEKERRRVVSGLEAPSDG